MAVVLVEKVVVVIVLIIIVANSGSIISRNRKLHTVQPFGNVE